MERIAIVKTGWCDYYDGDPVSGSHRFIEENGFGHEIYNMRPANGRFYVYLPPMGESDAAPSPDGDFDDWVVVLVARKDGKGPLVVVGWYEDARFVHDYAFRPDFAGADSDVADPRGIPYVYTMVANKAYFVPPEERNLRLPKSVLGRTPIFYCRGNAKAPPNANREVMARFVEKTVVGKLREEGVAEKVPSKNGDRKAGGSGYASKEHRDKVEKRSMEVVTSYYEKKGYKVEDVSMHHGRGYDLHASKSNTTRLVEVKGTAGGEEEFFITKNENYVSHDKRWRLCVVTNVFGNPKIKERTGAQYRKEFRLTATQYHCSKKA